MTNNPGALDVGDDEGYTPLHVAAGLGGLLTVELLLKLGATPDVRAPDGLSPADYAISGGYEQIAAMLRDRGASQTFDWSEWKVPKEEVYVTSPGSRLRITWAGVVTHLRTSDGQPPREDASNLEYKVKVTWVSSDSPYECMETPTLQANELEDAPRPSVPTRVRQSGS